MQIQLNTGNSIVGSSALRDQVQQAINQELRHVADAVTRVEVHLDDINGAKSGEDDKRCMLEARITGMKPLSVEHRAASIDLAVSGAASQLARAVKTSLAKANTQGKGGASIKHAGQNDVV